jgi:hypothetical protein
MERLVRLVSDFGFYCLVIDIKQAISYKYVEDVKVKERLSERLREMQ